ncbi:RDD family protein [Sulfitobacter mediterraneus]|jgi:uncharacterized RDD family membrane protein YckC|uniref:RDD family protein n=1 Tax=Sulfitobacter mediterraneus TaxID=83219 RepID=UPI000EA2CFD3|nr:RDD family protein [Sulfitobacter mediterraneus]MBM1309665.1 RDD family protein [Sulfitobacter mediterraneus]MBM1313550.1 RDD family protein [Sulfitobacter mediterraneus]MBM1321934.1 RDD family protein [Sulfitobacter mediterraneus]MBM1325821.1 RDD family protein [Sulfitobacter mediterraneus]MBM1397167.1 RDD family protein [Sulfitobacter mediterraneus]
MTPDPDLHPQFYEGIPAKRLFAWLIDAGLIFVLCLVIVPFTAFTGLFFFPLLMLVTGFAYRVITLANGSATWGMRLMSMEIRTRDDEALDLGTAFLHTLGYSISIAFAVVQLISIVLICTTARAQGLTDMVLGTVPMNRRR